MSNVINIEFVSDVSCPWCAVGYYELSNAIKQVSGDIDVSLSWLPFEINADMPKEGKDVKSYLLSKYGMNEAQQLQNMKQIEARGENTGFMFKPMIERHVYNSFSCHLLLHVAAQRRLDTMLKTKLFAAYFQQGKDISDESLLTNIALEVGLTDAEIHRAFNDNDVASAVRASIEQIKAAGITGVPTLIINNKYAISGAQGLDGYVDVLRKIEAKRE